MILCMDSPLCSVSRAQPKIERTDAALLRSSARQRSHAVKGLECRTRRRQQNIWICRPQAVPRKIWRAVAMMSQAAPDGAAAKPRAWRIGSMMASLDRNESRNSSGTFPISTPPRMRIGTVTDVMICSRPLLFRDGIVPRHIVCLTFDFDTMSGFIARGLTTPTPLSRGEFGARASPASSTSWRAAASARPGSPPASPSNHSPANARRW